MKTDFFSTIFLFSGVLWRKAPKELNVGKKINPVRVFSLTQTQVITWNFSFDLLNRDFNSRSA